MVGRQHAGLVLGRGGESRHARWPAGRGHFGTVARVAERHPGLRLHIDHYGRSGGATGGVTFDDLPDMAALARFSNVGIKVSGAPSYSKEAYPFRDLHDTTQRIFDSFGPSRILEAANRWALAAGMNVAIPSYHLADVVLEERANWPAWIPKTVTKISPLREAIERQWCRMLRCNNPIDDLTLLGAVVDAYKHAELNNKKRPVTSNRATVVTATGFGELAYGEGNYGGIDQVIVRINDGGSRALSSMLQNVIDMWRTALGRPLQPMGHRNKASL